MAWTLVTGGGCRLGAQICQILAQAGHHPIVHYRHREAEAWEVVRLCRAFGRQASAIQGDFSTLDTTQEFIERYTKAFPETENLINNVGNYFIQSALETSLEKWTELFQVNLHAPLALIQALKPSLISFKGSVINLGVSGLLSGRANTNCTAYYLTKMGLWQLTRSVARELAPNGVRVNMVSPGQLEISIDLPIDFSKIPMQRPAHCKEVGRVIAFLLHKENAYITGQNIEVAGGLGL